MRNGKKRNVLQHGCVMLVMLHIGGYNVSIYKVFKKWIHCNNNTNNNVKGCCEYLQCFGKEVQVLVDIFYQKNMFSTRFYAYFELF